MLYLDEMQDHLAWKFVVCYSAKNLCFWRVE